MFKKISLLTALLALCLVCSTAFAETKKFTHFSMDVPAGWAATEEGPTVTLIANDKSASMTITVSSLEGMTVSDFATAMSEHFKGSKPVLQDDAYHFAFKAGAVESNAMVADWGDGKSYGMIVVTGEHPQLEAMLNSME